MISLNYGQKLVLNIGLLRLCQSYKDHKEIPVKRETVGIILFLTNLVPIQPQLTEPLKGRHVTTP